MTSTLRLPFEELSTRGRLCGKDVQSLDSPEMSPIVGEERELVAYRSRAY